MKRIIVLTSVSVHVCTNRLTDAHTQKQARTHTKGERERETCPGSLQKGWWPKRQPHGGRQQARNCSSPCSTQPCIEHPCLQTQSARTPRLWRASIFQTNWVSGSPSSVSSNLNLLLEPQECTALPGLCLYSGLTHEMLSAFRIRSIGYVHYD